MISKEACWACYNSDHEPTQRIVGIFFDTGSNSLCHEDVDAKYFFWVCISPPFKVTMTWHALLRGGLCNFSDFVGTTVIRGVRVERLRPHCPALFLSGATPGQFYHSHPHVPSEFDHLDFSMEAQVRSNITTIHKIGRAVLDYSQVVPFNFGMDWLRSPYLLHWISGNGNGFASNLSVVEAAGPAIATELGMDKSHILGLVEVGDNVSDRRFLLETFGMFPLIGSDATGQRGHLRIDIKEEFDPQYFMPYVPGQWSFYKRGFV